MADSSPLRVANGEESSGEEEEEDVAGLELDMEEEEAAALEAEARGEQFDVDEELEGARAPPIVISRSFSEISRSSHLAVHAQPMNGRHHSQEASKAIGCGTRGCRSGCACTRRARRCCLMTSPRCSSKIVD